LVFFNKINFKIVNGDLAPLVECLDYQLPFTHQSDYLQDWFLC